MSYMHIDNLYKNQEILLFRKCYALEKVHGTSANVRWKGGVLGFYAGGANHQNFVNLFDAEKLTARFAEVAARRALK